MASLLFCSDKNGPDMLSVRLDRLTLAEARTSLQDGLYGLHTCREVVL